VNLYNVFLNNKIPFVLLESNESENVIYCKSFSDYLFNVGTFVTKTREVILEYVTEGEDKYVVADVTLDDGTCYRDVRFKIVVNEKIKTPHSTINLNILTNKTHVELPQQLAEIIEETQNVVSEIAEAQLPEMYNNTEAVQKALELERQIFEQREQLKQEKKNFEIEKKKAQIVLEKASTITKEIYEQIKPELEVYKNKLIVEFKKTSQKDLNEYVAKKLKEDFDSAANIDIKIQELVEKNSDLEFIKEEIKTYVTTTVNTSLQDAKNYARKILDLGGGGGSVAVQYANGGTMNGNLNVNGSYLSGGVDLLNIFSGGGLTDRLINGSYQVVLSSNGTLIFPGSGTLADTASVAQVGFEINGLFNYAGQTSVGLNTFNAGLGNPAWGPAIQANPTDYEIVFNGGLVATIASAAGTASPGARWDFTGSWPANPTGAPVTIRAKNYTPGVQGTDGIRLASNNNSWTFGTDGNLTFPTGSKISKGYPGQIQDGSSWFVAPAGDWGGLASADGEQYVQIGNNNDIYIGTNWPNSLHEWIFGRDGTTIFPNGAISSNGVITVLGGNSDQWNSAYTNISTLSAPQLPVPKILLAGTTDVQYLTGRSNNHQHINTLRYGGNITINKSPKLVVNDFTQETLNAYQIFIEMVMFKKSKVKNRYGLGLTHKVGFSVPISSDSGSKPWGANFWQRSGSEPEYRPAHGGLYPHFIPNVLRYNQLPVSTSKQVIDLTSCLNGRFREAEIGYCNDPLDPSLSNKYLNVIAPFMLLKDGAGKRIGYSARYKPMYVAFRYIAWLPSSNNGRGEIVSGPLSPTIRISNLRWPFKTNHYASSVAKTPVVDLTTSEADWNTYYKKVFICKFV